MSGVKKPLVLKKKPLVLKKKIKLVKKFTNNDLKGNNNFITVRRVKHNGNEYIVCEIKYIDSKIPFVVDAEDFHKIINSRLYCKVHNYIGSDIYIDGVKKVKYLHNTTMNRYSHTGKGQDTTIDHLNRIGFDNRKCNLEIKTQSDQNHNQRKRRRTVILPEGCEIKPDEIPQYIGYCKASGNHGEYFSIDIKYQGKKVIRKKTTKSKKKTLREKLAQAKLILNKIMLDYPQYFEGKCINGVFTGKSLENHKSYFEILKLAGVVDTLHDEDTINEHGSIMDTGNNKLVNYKVADIDPAAGIESLPAYVRYLKETKTRGDGFCYDRKTPDGSRTTIYSTRSRKVSTKEKYDELLKKLNSS